MEKANRIDGYTYQLSRADVKYIPKLNNCSDSDFFDYQPSIFVLKAGSRKNKVFKVFIQVGNCSQQILILPICNCAAVSTPNGEFRLPYEQSYDGVAQYALRIATSGQINWQSLIAEYNKNHRIELDDILGGLYE